MCPFTLVFIYNVFKKNVFIKVKKYLPILQNSALKYFAFQHQTNPLKCQPIILDRSYCNMYSTKCMLQEMPKELLLSAKTR